MALPARLDTRALGGKAKARQSKVCGVCGKEFVRDTSRYSHAQWEAKTFCSNRCSQYIPLSERLYSAIEKDPVSGCWNFTGTRVRGGYGRIVVRDDEGRRIQLAAHRAAYREWVEVPPAGAMVLHSCDNPSCINPAHLRLGTHADNMADKVARGRCRNQYGRSKNAAPEA